MFLKILIVIIGIILFFTLLKIGNNTLITKKNLELIQDIFIKLDSNILSKINTIIEWHKKHGYPIFIERSIKYLINTNSYNKDRFTIVVPLSYFFKNSMADIHEEKWLEYSKALELPEEIEKKCINYMALGRGDVDLIWGLELNASYKREKIYIEDEETKTIEAYIYSNGNILNEFIYYRKSIEHKNNKFISMYLRTNKKDNKIDSYHFVLRKPLKVTMKGKTIYIYIISYSKGESYTFYYRTS